MLFQENNREFVSAGELKLSEMDLSIQQINTNN